MKNLKKDGEYRSISIVADEAEDSRIIRGTAIVFNVLSGVIERTPDGRNVREIIDSSAISQEFLDQQDVRFFYNHDTTQLVLARSKQGNGTLKLIRTEAGVDFEFEAKNNAAGQNLLDAVRAGDVDKCSFGFMATKDCYKKTIENGEIIMRCNQIIEIFDISIVPFPAYNQTNILTRMLIDESDIEKKRLENYYNELKLKFL